MERPPLHSTAKRHHALGPSHLVLSATAPSAAVDRAATPGVLHPPVDEGSHQGGSLGGDVRRGARRIPLLSLVSLDRARVGHARSSSSRTPARFAVRCRPMLYGTSPVQVIARSVRRWTRCVEEFAAFLLPPPCRAARLQVRSASSFQGRPVHPRHVPTAQGPVGCTPSSAMGCVAPRARVSSA